MGRKTVRGQNPIDPSRPTMSLKKGSSIAMTASTETHQSLKLKGQTRERSYVECEVGCEHTETSESEIVMTDKRQELC